MTSATGSTSTPVVSSTRSDVWPFAEYLSAFPNRRGKKASFVALISSSELRTFTEYLSRIRRCEHIWSKSIEPERTSTRREHKVSVCTWLFPSISVQKPGVVALIVRIFLAPVNYWWARLIRFRLSMLFPRDKAVSLQRPPAIFLRHLEFMCERCWSIRGAIGVRAFFSRFLRVHWSFCGR